MAARDNFRNLGPFHTPPYRRAVAITPDDANDLVNVTLAISVGTTGTVKVTTVGGDTVTITVNAGQPFLIQAARIWATTTTALTIVAHWN